MLNDASSPYVANVIYRPHGGLQWQLTGNNLARTTLYNSRLQPVALWDDIGNDSNRFLFIENPICWGQSDSNCPAASVGKNNGNMYGTLLFEGGPSGWQNMSIWTQAYAYDNLNRLSSVSETSGWSRNFGYDQWGNMWVSGWSGIGLAPNTPGPQTVFANNQIKSQGFVYDNAGNLTNDNLGSSYTYDAEERLATATNSGATATYNYDGEGRRVLKSANGVTTAYVYDAGGNLARPPRGFYSAAVENKRPRK
jgi:YD repeat-containing protein